jgi:hypothetical protein
VAQVYLEEGVDPEQPIFAGKLEHCATHKSAIKSCTPVDEGDNTFANMIKPFVPTSVVAAMELDPQVMCCTVLHCTALHCTALRCAAQRSAAQRSAAQRSAALRSAAQRSAEQSRAEQSRAEQSRA